MFTTQTDYRRPGSLSPPNAEPMTLGSPTTSPSSPQKNFLPPFLIGEVPSQASPHHTPVGSWGSPVPKQRLSFSTPRMSPGMSSKPIFGAPVMQSTMISSPTLRKPGAPPVEGLFSSFSNQRQPASDFAKLEDSQHQQIPATNFNDSSISDFKQSNGVPTPNVSCNSTLNNTSTFVSPAQIDPFYTQGEALKLNSQLDETWVTVFGFPPASTSYILQQFQQYGKITEHKLATSGNWIHLRYQSKLQAKKALSKNGKVFGSSMVGVKPCIEMDLMNECGKENSSVEDSRANFCQENMEGEFLDSNKRNLAKIRPLTQIYKTPTSDTEGTPKTQVKSASFVSKAVEYFKYW